MAKIQKIFYIDKKNVRRLKKYKTEEVSEAEIVRRALDKYFESKNKSNENNI